ncbi:MAG: hypothetical protein ACLQO1_07295 [Steroidobacteraceae bacterium]
MDDISIDRLILEIPGLTADQGMELARAVGAQLAASMSGGGEFPVLSVTVEALQSGTGAPDPGRLATAIVSALLRRME